MDTSSPRACFPIDTNCRRYRDDKSSTDVELVLHGGDTILAHRLILAAGSKYFEEQLLVW